MVTYKLHLIRHGMTEGNRTGRYVGRMDLPVCLEGREQLEEMKKGNITAHELDSAKAGVASDLRSAMDSQGALEGFFLSQTLLGLDYGPMELAELVSQVQLEDVIAVAQSVECDLVYFMRGPEDEEAENEDE